MISVDQILATATEKLIVYVPKVLLGIVVLIVGLYAIKSLIKVMVKNFKKRKIEPSLGHFLCSLTRISLKIVLFITVISMFGVQMTSFVAIIGAAGLAIGLALQGSLANFAGGVLILFFKPYKLGDFIETQGHKGTVDKIQIFNTILKTPDNKVILIPNAPISNGSLVNYSTEPTRRVDMVFGIGYGSNLKKAKELLEKIVKKDKRILKDPTYSIVVSELADSSVNLSVKVWVKKEDYWDVYFAMQENVKLTFDKNKIEIPYPHMDVTLTK